MVLLVSTLNTVRLQRAICGVGQEAALKKATNDEAAIKLDQKEQFLGLARGGGHDSEQRHRSINCIVQLGVQERQEMGGWLGWSRAGSGLDPPDKCTSPGGVGGVFRKMEDSLFPGHDTK